MNTYTYQGHLQNRITQDYFEGKCKGVWVNGSRAPYILFLSTEKVDSNDKASDFYSGNFRFESLQKHQIY